ncbi:hypothetical protein VTO73DRAFT_3874 [Trametes versicolor]
MIEPEQPVVIHVKQRLYPAFLLASDEGKPLSPHSVILRHRHLRQQQRVLIGLSGGPLSGAKRTRGVSVPVEGSSVSAQRDGALIDVQMANRAAVATSSLPAVDVSSPTRPPQEQVSSSTQVIGRSTNAGTKQTTPHPDPVHAPPSFAPRELGGKAPTPTLPPAALHVERHAHGIRCRNEKTVWFSSTSPDLLQAPPVLSLACLGDLFVHNCNDGTKQAWLCTGPSQWVSVELGQAHPYLKGYVLNFCGNGEPSWVKKDTVRTYNGRKKQRERKQANVATSEHASTSTTGESGLSLCSFVRSLCL